MSKRLSIKLLVAGVIAAAVISFAAHAMAFCDQCDPVDRYDHPEGWTAELVGDPQPCTETGELDTNGVWYRWNYKFYETTSGSANGLNYAAILIPDCCTGPYVRVNTMAGTRFNKPNIAPEFIHTTVGVGEPSDCFGCFIQQAYVVWGTANDSVPDWYLIADTNVKTSTTIQLDVKKLKEMQFEIAGPGCGQATQQTAYSSAQCITVERGEWPISMTVERDASGRPDIYTATFYKTVDCTGESFTISDEEVLYQEHPEGLIYCTGGANDSINECIKLRAHSPGCVDYYVGSSLCTFCW